MHRFVLVALCGSLSVSLWADDPSKPPATPASASVSTAPDNINPDEIIQKFAAKEKQFREALENYTYKQTVKFQELDESGTPEGRYEIVQDITFTPEGKRTEHVTYAPVITLQHILLSPEDMEDMKNTQPFVLTTDEVPFYDIRYLGKQNADEISCYVFSVKPKKLLPGKRFFEGQIWVDDRDFQIVKTYGKGVGLLKRHEDQQFPKFETLREQIDGKYWFPTYTYADDTLHFKDLNQHIRMIVTYKDYKKFQGKSTITFGDVVDTPPKDQPKPEQKKP